MGNYFISGNTKEFPPFIGRLAETVAKSWESQGSVACKFAAKEDKYEVMFFPAIREVLGGKTDGERCYAGFQFNIGRFVRIFDKCPKVLFDCMKRNTVEHIIFIGQIEGKNIKVAITAAPPTGQTPIERIYATGPKRGTIEKITRVH
jgi:hypothetical protein